MTDQDNKATNVPDIMRFTRTGGLWLLLSCAVLTWLVLSVWAYKISLSNSTRKQVLASEPALASSLQSVANPALLPDLAASGLQVAGQADTAARLAMAEQAQSEAGVQASTRMRAQNGSPAASLATQAQKSEPAQAASGESPVQARQLAAAAQEAVDAQVLASAARLSTYEQTAKDETSVISGLSARVRFAERSDVVTRELERTLDPIFDPLFLYSDVPVTITVASHDFTGVTDNNRLSRDRGRAIVAYLVGRGLDIDRFRVFTTPGEGLPYGSHRVKVAAEDPFQ